MFEEVLKVKTIGASSSQSCLPITPHSLKLIPIFGEDEEEEDGNDKDDDDDEEDDEEEE